MIFYVKSNETNLFAGFYRNDNGLDGRVVLLGARGLRMWRRRKHHSRELHDEHPGGEAVPYGTTRATHDEAEWTIHRLTLYVYSVDDAGRGTFLRRYATDASGDQAISIVSNGAGTYNFTLKAPVSDLKARQRFVFVANDAFDEPSPGESQDELENKLAGIVLEEGHSADKLAAKGTGIAMSGIARSNSSDVVTITPGVKCEVSLRRIVARVDVQNNTPNLVIGSIELLNAAPRGYRLSARSGRRCQRSYIPRR